MICCNTKTKPNIFNRQNQYLETNVDFFHMGYLELFDVVLGPWKSVK